MVNFGEAPAGYQFNKGRIVIEGKDILILEISKEEVVNLQFNKLLEGIKEVEEGPTKGFSSILFSIKGYDEDSRELYEIDKVRRFYNRLVKKIPHFLYYVNPMNQMPGQIIGALAFDIIKVETEENKKENRHSAEFFLESSLGYCMIDSIEQHIEKNGFEDTDNELPIVLKLIEWSIPKDERREDWEFRY